MWGNNFNQKSAHETVECNPLGTDLPTKLLTVPAYNIASSLAIPTSPSLAPHVAAPTCLHEDLCTSPSPCILIMTLILSAFIFAWF